MARKPPRKPRQQKPPALKDPKPDRREKRNRARRRDSEGPLPGSPDELYKLYGGPDEAF
jgi:hypothetical protein